MDNLKFKTPNGIDKNIEKISAIFPEVITETKDENGNLKRVIDAKKLSLLLGDSAVDSDYKECYEFTWPGKNEAIMEAAKATTNTLRPCKEESKNWDTTRNLYIEGDNLEVLKLLQESYLGKVKMIYIDPPYNTGKDFVYRDNFHKKADEYKEENTERDDEENQLFQNTETNGRFHSDWCSMIYPRLKLARDLLREDGVIFISIDDNEVRNLRNICDEIFGELNFVGNIIVKSNPRGSQSVDYLAYQHEHIIIYAKNINEVNIIGHVLSEEMLNEYKFCDKIGKYRLLGLRQRGGFWRRIDRPFLYYPIFINEKTGDVSLEKSEGFTYSVTPYQPSSKEEGTWRWSKEKFLKEKNFLIAKPITRDGKNDWDIFQKDYLNKDGRAQKRTKAKSLWDDKEMNYQNGTEELKEIFLGNLYFSYPKPTSVIKKCLEMLFCEDEMKILDFFSGSATTAHACMQLNAEDGGNRKFIMVQLPEVCAPDSEAAKAGYKNICEIGKERIRRAGEKIKSEHATTAPNLDIGFRVLKLDSSNMKDVFYSPDEISQDLLASTESNIKKDRTPLDLLYSCLIDWGVDEGLSLPIKTETIDGAEVFTVNDGEIPDLIACFAENISTNAIKQIASKKPLRVVFRDSSFADSPAKINVTEIFKTISPNTTIKVL